jgi:hypothetical protein
LLKGLGPLGPASEELQKENAMTHLLIRTLFFTLVTAGILHAGQKVTLMDDTALEAFRATVSGALAKSHIVALSQMHRVQASEGYHRAAEYVRDRAVSYGLEEVRIIELPADGETRYNHFRAYYGWQAEEGTLWEVAPRKERIADYAEMRVALADYSQDADVTTELVDVGQGIGNEDYEGKEVRGKIVLAGGSVASVHREAVAQRGAAGILSYFPNQRTGWSGDDVDQVRWGHLDPANTGNRFAFMIGLRKAREFRGRLAAGEKIELEARVRARLVPANYEVVTGVIPGSELPQEEIVFTCHLDHQNPGANDNASGAATILEVARTLSLLVSSGRIPPPRRTIRFVWPPEIAGTYAFLARHPDITSRLKAGIHMDMVGGIPQTNKSIFFLSRPPASLPSFIGDVGEVFFDYVKTSSRNLAAHGDFGDAILSPEGTKEDFVAEVEGINLGSDHQVLEDSYFGIPTLNFHDWPDIYIHTNKDRPEHLDATKLQRVAFLGATTGYTLARLGVADTVTLAGESSGRAASRLGKDQEFALELMLGSDGDSVHQAYGEALIRIEGAHRRETAAMASIATFTGAAPDSIRPFSESLDGLREGALVAAEAVYLALCKVRGLSPRERSALMPPVPAAARRVPFRTESVKGPLGVYYFDYLVDRLGREEARSGLAGDVRYEVLNFVDGKRTVEGIRNAVSAELEPIPLAAVLDYLTKLERAEVIAFRDD